MNTGSRFIVTTFGTQNVITNTIDGNGDILDIDAEQTSENNGDVQTNTKYNFTDIENDIWSINVGF